MAVLIVAACSSDISADEPAAATSTEAAAAPDDTDAPGDGAQPSGGTLVLAVEQWPECINPVTSCANASWTLWSVLVHVLPRLMELDVGNDFVASSLLVEAPSVDNGGLVTAEDGTFTLTYRLNPEAVWSDGTPITSTDVWFTWRAGLDTTGTLSTIGLELITDIDHSDPHTAVVTFSESYAPWQTLFGGLLPAHELGPDTDIADKWNDEITISGGPWISEEWGAQQHIMVPNRNYWDADRIPQLDRVVMVPREDTDSEMLALQTGEVMAAFPQPFPGANDRIAGDLVSAVGEGTFIEGLWINQDAPDRRFDLTTNVRQAIAYALDRERIADVALGSIIPDPQVLQCAGWNPGFGDWCRPDFEQYGPDAAKVAELLEAEGWTRPDPDGLWINADGEELVLAWNTVAGNKRREDVQALVVEMTAPYGIGWEIINYDAGELFQNRLPVMNFGPVALFANSTNPDPSVTSFYDIDGVPTEENGYTGQNFTAYRSQQASDLAFEIDAEVDPAARLELVHQLSKILADDMPWIPLYVLPNLLVWDTSVVDGPGAYASSPYGGFFDMYDWTVTE
ncbi:ABC transporter substrate-binding protein [Candidatus Poriferisodalis sp.]|uniref:ABC transporter substrate-binding protein n=1 Tax=Candidatus Poriferisodalis sp. TaxID=3101277 RepID=UPI003B02085E